MYNIFVKAFWYLIDLRLRDLGFKPITLLDSDIDLATLRSTNKFTEEDIRKISNFLDLPERGLNTLVKYQKSKCEDFDFLKSVELFVTKYETRPLTTVEKQKLQEFQTFLKN